VEEEEPALLLVHASI
jgi:hypothetical protein